MLLKVVSIASALFLAFAVLTISISRLSSPNYAFYQMASADNHGFTTSIEYNFPYPGIAPDHLLWPVKVLRDKVWLMMTFNPEKKFRLLLLFADKRVLASQELMEREESELAVSTAERAEAYLVEALDEAGELDEKNSDKAHLYDNLGRAALKHREILEGQIKIAPDDAKPYLSQIVDVPKNVYDTSVSKLQMMGKSAPTPLPQVKSY